ncbi:TIGR04372 family glycosyltransferase, partial [Candidatus Thioglobus sp.]|nr:TIGR04372 family glycosyltransferase [Candidatus Thioglobus sp.]
KGYQIVLMGDAALSVVKLDGVILYCKSKIQSVVNDSILIKNCNFYIGNSSGPMVNAPFYHKPQLLLNAMCLATLFSQENQRVLPKTITKDGKSLTIRELFESPIYYFDSNVEFDRLGYKYQDNSEEEIYESVLEFEKLVESNDFSLTNKQEIFKKNIKSYHMGAYIFKGFLCNHIL